MKSIELFAGIGGISLAAEWAGIETIAFCEREPFPQKVLKKHWPGVPIFDDVCTLNRQVLEESGVIERGGTVDIISGGWPCQPFATVNRKRKGSGDERYLWPEMFRLIDELRPNWVVGENVADFSRSDEHEQVHKDLESIGYQTQPFIMAASTVGAPHRRYRTFIVAYTSNKSEPQTNKAISTKRKERDSWRDLARWYRRKVPGSYWDVYKPGVPGVDDGIPDRVDRSGVLGNAVVPQQIYPIFKAIIDIEGGCRDGSRA
ncbi:DNA (cytosine-5)-methyltransferase 1 [Scopulibacillus darangshiensis]|uniref:DNA (cytosine-5-)-methyltransferase n=1 Tax=Scopulibacillus darangshiensis TaxID=442528 RepID=A0A4R2PE16_9BACL|nr:DNA cytosine methyltransferase [Scopulibacillus darangshiensis]TCP32165.1 DNA (cytosine-5)-methyltransferase 1 [Scopulibacillus darangshiensis]